MTMVPPQFGHRQSDRGVSLVAGLQAACEVSVCPKNAKQSGNNAARRR